jgi:hypothetical protein
LLFGLPGFFAGAFLGNLVMAVISWRTFNSALHGEQQILEKAA